MLRMICCCFTTYTLKLQKNYFISFACSIFPKTTNLKSRISFFSPQTDGWLFRELSGPLLKSRLKKALKEKGHLQRDFAYIHACVVVAKVLVRREV